MSNGLAGSRSPFLQHGAHQPVDWMPWGAEAFARAREADKPILLDIGAIWCHWCHVMDRESYENTQTAALINELFIPVKVDRDESPDVDARYQRAVQLLTGGGGWPLTAFLTHDGSVFYGGTYFPPEDGHGRPSLQRVLREVHRVWTTERDRALEAANGIEQRLQTYAMAEAEGGTADASLIADTAEDLATSFDFRYGGFGGAPKFPNAGALDLLIDVAIDDDIDWARRMVTETLTAMGRGGIYDQIGGGFHRYATDARWLIPHFEKMAYDNGALLETYARAAAAFGDDFFRRVANGIMEHYEDVAPALLERGGFPASQDADYSAADDGDYWTWTPSEIRDALKVSDAPEIGTPNIDIDRATDAVIAFFGVEDRASAMHIDPSRHVLFRARNIDGIARELGVPQADAVLLIRNATTILKRARDARPRPYVDETVYTGWNALVASGHLAAARYLGSDKAKTTGINALEAVHNDAFRDAHGLLHRAGDERSGYMLDDQAHAAVAYIDAYEVTGDDVWLERAHVLLELMDAHYKNDSGALQDRPHSAEAVARPLAQPQLSITDSPTPSGNGSAALANLRYAALTGDDGRQQRGLEILFAFGKAAARFKSAASTYLKALAWATRDVTKVVIVADPRSSDGRALIDVAYRQYVPRMALRVVDPGRELPTELPAELRAMVTADAPRAYVCVGRTCAAPIAEPADLARVLREFRG
jgi:uncharacterized protein YyaL (SSP411 family)